MIKPMNLSKIVTLNNFRLNLKNLVLIIVAIGVLMSAVDSTIVVLALPTIDASLNTFPALSVWIILIYAFMITIVSTHVGKLGDMFGRSKMYNFGFLIFTIGSLFCGFANSIYLLIAFRAVQGIGGAFIAANSGAVVSDYFEVKERGKAFGFTNLGWMVGAVLGIVLGGFLIDIDWRWIFLINVPIGFIIGPIGLIKMKDKHRGLSERIDYIGSILLGLALLIISFASVLITEIGLNLLTLVIIYN